MPLTRVGQGQYEKLRQLKGCRPCLLTRKTACPSLFEGIRAGRYTHILLSPELAVSRGFHDVCIDPQFRQRVALVTIDEAHLISQWGHWRTQYNQLHVLRSRLGCSVAWFACSATLNAATLDEIIEKASFDTHTKVIRTSVDRPEISITILRMPARTKASCDSLFFTINKARDADGVYTPQRIPKTIIFLDSRRGVIAAVDKLRAMLRQHCQTLSTKDSQRCIKVYHAHLAETDKNLIYEQFQREDSFIRIVIATDAMGLGVDILDIAVVVQYGIPSTDGISTVVQRWGRAARGNDRVATAVWLVDSWAFEPSQAEDQHGVSPSVQRDPPTQLASVAGDLSDEDSSDNDSHLHHELTPRAPVRGSKRRAPNGQSDEEKRLALAPKVHAVINTTTCRRTTILDFLGELSHRQLPSPSPCCDNCDESLRNVYTPLPSIYKATSTRAPRKNTHAKALIVKLTD